MTANTNSTTRKSVEKTEAGKNRFGPIYLLRITYTDGRVAYGCSSSGCLSLFGPNGEEAAKAEAEAAARLFPTTTRAA